MGGGINAYARGGMAGNNGQYLPKLGGTGANSGLGGS
jgi:hypothetical protein